MRLRTDLSAASLKSTKLCSNSCAIRVTVCSGIDLSKKIVYFQTSFSLETALMLDVNFVTSVWFRLFYRTRDQYLSARAA